MFCRLYSAPALGNSILGRQRRSNEHAICFKQVKKEWRQVNEKFFELKKGHIGIVEKAQETSLRCVLECRETPTSQVTI